MFNISNISCDFYKMEEKLLAELNKFFNGEIDEIRSNYLNLDFLFQCIEKVVGEINIPERKGKKITSNGYTEYWIWFYVNEKRYRITGKFFSGTLTLMETY